ncbi:hypothetical protein IKU74_04030 [bacterium]|nr:hypothetical protein [bacterium]
MVIKFNLIGRELESLRTQKMMNYVTGDYKAYKKSAKQFAKLAVENPDVFREFMHTPRPEVKLPLFSKHTLKMLKIWFCEKFRIKAPEEKELKKIVQENSFDKKYFSN